MKKHQNNRKLTKALLMIYVAMLTWIILLKMEFSISYLPNMRSVNLIPFGQSVILNGKLFVGEIIFNLVAFMPLGVLIEMLYEDVRLYKKVISIVALTLFYEVSQFVFHIGATDITDVLMNTLGGIIGIAIVAFLYKVFQNKNKVNMVINALAIVSIVLFVGFFAVLFVVNM